jgi:LysM repeat protein
MAGAVDYTVVLGDFLSEITRTFYGRLTDVGPAGTRNGFYYPLLMLASEGQIEDPDLIFPGTNLKIPDLEKNLANSTSRRAIKDALTRAVSVYRGKYLPDEADGLQRLADWL